MQKSNTIQRSPVMFPCTKLRIVLMTNTEKAQEAKKLGNAAYAKKDYATAAKHFTEAISLDDEDNIFYSNRSACRAQLKDVCPAVRCLVCCCTLSPLPGRPFSHEQIMLSFEHESLVRRRLVGPRRLSNGRIHLWLHEEFDIR